MNPIVSFVQSAIAIATISIKAASIIEDIRNGRWKGQTELIRAQFTGVLVSTNDFNQAKRAVAQLKKELPAVIWSGSFNTRSADVPLVEKLVAHSGLLAADLDDLPPDKMESIRAALLTSPHLWGLFTSPTGTGLKAVFRVEADMAVHERSFRAVQSHVRQLCGVEVDSACKDIARLCFTSYDPAAYVNRDASVLPPLPEAPGAIQSAAPAPTINLTIRQHIAAELLGAIEWKSDTTGFCSCPGRNLHTNSNGPRDCEVRLNRVPTVHCFHNSCREAVDRVNHELRSRIGKAEFKTNVTMTEHVRPGSVAAEYLGPTNPSDDLTFVRLAALPPAEYDRVRKSEAGSLGIRVTVLDAEVASRRTKPGTAHGTAVDLPVTAPWPEPVDGAGLLNDIRREIQRFCWLPGHCVDALAAWILQTYVYESFEFCAIVAVHSPEPQCGKGRILEVINALCRNGFWTSNTSAAVIYHKVSEGGLTVLIDELDSQSDEQRFAIGNVLKSGFQSNGKAHRMAEVNGKQEIVEFPTYCPKIVASIGLDSLDKASRSRAISIPMQRKPRGVEVEKFRRYDGSTIRAQCRRWAADNGEALRAVGEIKIEECNTDRQEDVWEPILAIGRVAGGGWEDRLRSACRIICGGHDGGGESLAHSILAACHEFFREGPPKVSTKDLCGWINEKTELGEMNRGRGVTPRWLAKNLAPYGITPGTIRLPGGDTPKGYHRDSFVPAFEAYLTPYPVGYGFSERHNATPPANPEQNGDSENATETKCGVSENSIPTNNHRACGVVADARTDSSAEPIIIGNKELL